jgi:hypothetical protein
MAITYPLALPAAPKFRVQEFAPRSAVGITVNEFTFQQRVTRWPGQVLVFNVELPPMKQAVAAVWAAWFLALNGTEGTFYLGPQVRTTTGGNKAGAVTVNTGATANSTTLPITGGTGDFAVGDWLQVGATTAARLHRVAQVNSGSVDVWPRLRSAYANGTTVIYTNPVGIFRLLGLPVEAYEPGRLARGMGFSAMEVLT